MAFWRLDDEVPVEAVRRLEVVAIGRRHLAGGLVERDAAEARPIAGNAAISIFCSETAVVGVDRQQGGPGRGVDLSVPAMLPGTRIVGAWARNGIDGWPVGRTNAVPTGCSPRYRSMIWCWTRPTSSSPKKRATAASIPAVMMPNALPAVTKASCGSRSSNAPG